MLFFHAGGTHSDTVTTCCTTVAGRIAHTCRRELVLVLLSSPQESSNAPTVPQSSSQHERNGQPLIVIGPVDTLY